LLQFFVGVVFAASLCLVHSLSKDYLTVEPRLHSHGFFRSAMVVPQVGLV
jgi:hypothetical protein